MNELTLNSTAINIFLDIMGMFEREGIIIPEEDRPAIRKCITDLIRIIGKHYEAI